MVLRIKNSLFYQILVKNRLLSINNSKNKSFLLETFKIIFIFQKPYNRGNQICYIIIMTKQFFLCISPGLIIPETITNMCIIFSKIKKIIYISVHL